jgi:hypothetical protein
LLKTGLLGLCIGSIPILQASLNKTALKLTSKLRAEKVAMTLETADPEEHDPGKTDERVVPFFTFFYPRSFGQLADFVPQQIHRLYRGRDALCLGACAGLLSVWQDAAGVCAAKRTFLDDAP